MLPWAKGLARGVTKPCFRASRPGIAFRERQHGLHHDDSGGFQSMTVQIEEDTRCRGSKQTGSRFLAATPHDVAGVRYEAQRRDLRRELEVLELAFEARGTALVPVGAGG